MGFADILIELAKHPYAVLLDNSSLTDFNPVGKEIGDYIWYYRRHADDLDFILEKMTSVLSMATGVAGEYEPPLRAIIEARNKGWITAREAEYGIKTFLNNLRVSFCSVHGISFYSFLTDYLTEDEISEFGYDMEELKKFGGEYEFSSYLPPYTQYRCDYWDIRRNTNSTDGSVATAYLASISSSRELLPHLNYTPTANPFLSFKRSTVYVNHSELNFSNEAPLFFTFTPAGGEIIQYNSAEEDSGSYNDEASYGEYPMYSTDYDIVESYLLIIDRKPKNSKSEDVVTKKCFVRIKPFGLHLKTLFQTAHHLIGIERKFNINREKTFIVEFCESAFTCLIKLLEAAIINTQVAKLSPSVATQDRIDDEHTPNTPLQYAATVGTAYGDTRQIDFVYGAVDSYYETIDSGFNYQCPIAQRVIDELQSIQLQLTTLLSEVVTLANDYKSDVDSFFRLAQKDKTPNHPIEKSRVIKLDELDTLFFNLATSYFDVRINDCASWELIFKLKPGTYYIL